MRLQQWDSGALHDIGHIIGHISCRRYLVHNWMPDIVTKLFGPMPKYQAAPIVRTMTFGICILSWHSFKKTIMGSYLELELEKANRSLRYPVRAQVGSRRGY